MLIFRSVCCSIVFIIIIIILVPVNVGNENRTVLTNTEMKPGYILVITVQIYKT